MLLKIKNFYLKYKKIVLISTFSLLVIFSILMGWLYQAFFSSNVVKDFSLYIRSNATYQEVIDSLEKNQVLKNNHSFQWVSQLRKYPELVKPGHYRLQSGTSNWKLVNKLRAGIQDPVTIRFESKRTLDELLKVITYNLEINDLQLKDACLNPEFLSKNQLTQETVISIFIPNTYQVYWNIKPEKLLDLFVQKRNEFFAKHQKQLEILGMTPVQISILASIVEAETYRDAEKKRIAGVYYNRLKKNMRLQADPTVIFAIGDFTKTRVLRSDLQIDSPYNTYKYKGLPIGPINAPGVASLEAALYPENHDFIFFCAKPDFSGYHDFSSDYNEHLKQAKAYQIALDKLYKNSKN